jgi:hypothetical protein
MSEGAGVPREYGGGASSTRLYTVSRARGSPGPIFGAIGRFASEAEERLVETIAMAEVHYVPVDDQGEPSRWALEETWHAARDRVSFGGVPAPVFAGRGGY